jgi:hypothetical protein
MAEEKIHYFGQIALTQHQLEELFWMSANARISCT